MTAISRHKIIAPKSGGGTDTALDSRVTNLENNEYKILYFETISSSTGTITKPTGATILLDQFYSGGDAIVETLSNGQPTGQSPLTVGGSVVSVSSFDTSGNYTLSGTPSSFDVALVYIFKIKAVDYSNLYIANIMAMENQVGAILGTLPATSGQLTYSNGTLNTLTSSSSLTFNGSNLNVGSATPLITQDFNVARSLAGVASAVGFSITNTNSTGLVANNFGESSSNRLTIGKYGSTSSATVSGTSLNYQNSSLISSTSGGSFGGGNLYIQGSPIINIIGSASTNVGTRLDSVGLRVDAINALHTTNTNSFTVNGRSFFGGNTSATAIMHVAASTNANAQLRLESGVTPTSPNNGDIWFDGTDIKMRIGGVTKTFTLI